MKLPKKFKIMEQDWTVCRGDMETADGLCQPEHRRIVLNHKLRGAALAEVLLHELFHAIIYTSGYHIELADDEEEKLVSRLSPLLYAAIARNRLDFADGFDDGL